MTHTRWLLGCGIVAAALVAGCATRAAKDDLGAKESALPASLPGISVPLDLREFEVVNSDGGYRGVFLKLSRLPDAVTHSSQSDPARIILDIKGPTGADAPVETFPGRDTLVSKMHVSRELGTLRVVLDLQGEAPPDYTVHSMADWIMIRIKPPKWTKG